VLSGWTDILRKMNSILAIVFRVLKSSLLSLNIDNKCQIIKLSRKNRGNTIVFVVSPEDVNTLGAHGLYPDKVLSLHNFALQIGWNSEIIYHPWSSSKRQNHAARILRIESVLSAFSIYLETIRLNTRGLSSSEFRQWWDQIGKMEKLYFCSWVSFLSKTKPQIVFGIDAKESQVKGCGQFAIPIVEIMHGTFTELNPPLRRLIRGKMQTIDVDLFLSWDASYSRIMHSFHVPTLEVGHPNKDFADKHFKVRAPNSRNLLVSLSWGVENSKDPYGTLHEQLFERISGLDLTQCKIRFRLHPVSITSNRSQIPFIQGWCADNFLNSEVSSPNTNTLIEDLLWSDVHITHESSTFYEAGLLGVQTVFTNLSMFESVPLEFKLNGGVNYWDEAFNLEDKFTTSKELKSFGKKLDVEVFGNLLATESKKIKGMLGDKP